MDGQDRTESIKNALFGGTVTAAVIAGIWLLTTSIRETAAAILVTPVVLFGAEFLIRFLFRRRGKKTRAAVNAGMTILTVFVFIAVCAYTLAPKILFYPNRDENAERSLAAVDYAEEITFEGKNGTVSGWLLNSAAEDAPLILYFGGNGESAASKLAFMAESERYAGSFAEYRFAFLDYPSYGKSGGTASERSFQEHGLDAYDYFSEERGVSEIYLFGYSIGTGVANYVASQRDVRGLALLAPYANGYDLYNRQLNIFYGPLRLLVAFRMEAEEYAREVRVTPLIYASDTDETVPYESSKRLSEAYPNGAEFRTVAGAAHNELFRAETFLGVREYFNAARESA